ncbi:major facilitator superfamily domain-containing protein [Calycina marina]|uniref:Major facilitator superfamily domain-containing protein n=1 Tax=Calycina marina TaxID=1763456 RepID=A0A9P7Z926_9HELO|nr:major facilitator superfamily domain-containing protein [Calycina marina]
MSPSHHEETLPISHEVMSQDDVPSIHSATSSHHHGIHKIKQIPTHASHSHDAPHEQYTSNIEVPDEIYDRLTDSRKIGVIVVVSFCSFLAPISSTSILAGIPEVTATYHTTGDIINISNALYMFFMGISPCFWGPLSQVYGRRNICLITAVLFIACSIGTALSPNLASYFIFRILTAFEGTSFLTVGAACIGDIYRPTERGTAMGWFLSGTLIGPALGPFIGGIIVTFKSWRVIFYLQAALAGAGLIGAFFFLPETIHQRKSDDLVGLPLRRKAAVMRQMCNPWRVVRLWRYPNLLMVALSSSSLVWNMYSLLTPIRYVLNPRFNLTTPIQSGLFYLAPGCGYMLGTFFGGRYADFIVKKYIEKRGVRIPEDRLRSALPFMGIVIPCCMLIYGWSIEKRFGGVALPVIMMFFQGVAQLFCFPSLNTYCLDVMQNDGAEVIAGNYVIRYMFGAVGSAVVLPAVTAIGVGWFSSISALFLVVGACMMGATVIWGKCLRDDIDQKRRAKRAVFAEIAVQEKISETA